MDAFEMLAKMHVEARSAFHKIEAAAPLDRGALWQALQQELKLHEQLEEQFVYDPVAKDLASSDPVLGAWEPEHEAQVADADAVIAAIEGLEPTGDQWLREVRALHQTLDGHNAHEENDIWPRIRAGWGPDNLADAGQAIAAAKAEAGSRNTP